MPGALFTSTGSNRIQTSYPPFRPACATPATLSRVFPISSHFARCSQSTSQSSADEWDDLSGSREDERLGVRPNLASSAQDGVLQALGKLTKRLLDNGPGKRGDE